MFDGGRMPRHRGTCGGALTWRGDFAPAPSLDGDPSRPTRTDDEKRDHVRAKRRRQRARVAARRLNERVASVPMPRHLTPEERRRARQFDREAAKRALVKSMLATEPPLLSTDERIALQARDEDVPAPSPFPQSWKFRR